MIIGRALRRAAVAAGAVVAAGCFQVAPASAQLFWDWGGGSMVDGSGREVVRFSPQFPKGQIIVSFGDRRLYLITKAGTATSYPIAVPREQSRWQGTTSVTDKRVNPSWRPTPEMLRENPKLPLWVPGGHRMNPLGVRAMYLGSSTYRIHGTDAPWTIGQAVSKGCIRMLNEDVLDLYPKIPVGTKVTVTWQRFNSQAVASGDEPAPYDPAADASAGAPAYKAPPRSIRTRTPAANVETVAATNDMGAPAVDPSADEATLAAAAEKPLEKKPVKKAEAHKKPAPHEDAVAIAERAAAAAAKAAEAARAAAEAAKKAAEDAKKATSAQSPEPGKSAAL